MQITAQAAKRLSGVDGMHRAAPGLYLRVRGGSSLWMCRFMQAGKAHEISLGAFSSLTLAAAVAQAADIRARLREGETVLPTRALNRAAEPVSAPAAPLTFKDVAERLWESMRPGWKNPKHADQWINTLRTYAFAHFGSKPVGEVTTDDVLAALTPIWQDKHETATRVRQRIEAVLSAAKARGLRTGENPAGWRGHLDALLPTISKKRRVEHHAAMPFGEVPAFMADLRQRSNMSAWALQFTILTACRTGEVIGARWEEFDLAAGLWIVPAARMKAQREHRVPLSTQALDLLRAMPRMERGDAVFWGSRKPTISNMAMLELLRGMRPGLTVHGFRSSFRDWAAECTSYPAEVVEMALAHTIQNQVEAAYRRGDLLEKRRGLMREWAGYLGALEKG
ncbi:tyrosine-type recombinase/integrase [Thiomonas intermedia]|uniref:tyrosine-type recombinase/integrase n=1 Tax=Thiomonas intermedia TaxID=926 RepID=UPI0009A4EFA4|nr:site-specific integrase [Thiomonas intermedia]